MPPLEHAMVATAPTYPLNVLTAAAFFRRTDVRQAQQTLTKAKELAEKRTAHVASYIVPLLATFDLRADQETSRPGLRGEKITNPDLLYLSNDEEQLARFYAACDAAHKANGYDLQPGYCPACVARHDLTKAEAALIDLFADAFGASWREVYGKQREELLDLLMNPPRR